MGGFIDGVGMGAFIDGVGMGGLIDGVGMEAYILPASGWVVASSPRMN